MITTNRRTVGTCTYCGQSGLALAALDGSAPNTGLCGTCWDRAGDENAVADGHLTCAAFAARYDGDHSDYCDCAPVAPADPQWTVNLTTTQINRLFAALIKGEDTSRLSDDDLNIMLALNGADPVPFTK